MRPARLDHTFFQEETRPHLGSLLLSKGLITHEQLDSALEERAQNGGFLGATLVRLGYAFEDEIARVLAEQEKLEFLDVGSVSVDGRAAIRLDLETAQRLQAVPVRFLAEGPILVAVADPLVPGLAQQLERAIGHPVKLVVATPTGIATAWREVRRLTT